MSQNPLSKHMAKNKNICLQCCKRTESQRTRIEWWTTLHLIINTSMYGRDGFTGFVVSDLLTRDLYQCNSFSHMWLPWFLPICKQPRVLCKKITKFCWTTWDIIALPLSWWSNNFLIPKEWFFYICKKMFQQFVHKLDRFHSHTKIVKLNV